MPRRILVPALALAALALPLSAQAKPGGCLKYGAAGAVAGHMAHHGVMGAVAGCALGIHKRREYKRGNAHGALIGCACAGGAADRCARLLIVRTGPRTLLVRS